MLTVLFYILVILTATFFLWRAEKSHKKCNRLFFSICSFLIVFLPSALRYDIGTDYLSYVEIYENLESYAFIEQGFYYLNWMLLSVGAHVQWVFVLFSFLFTVAVFLGLPKKDAWLVFLVFFLLVWFFSFSGIRQALAIAMSLVAFKLFFQGRVFLFIVTLVLAGLFHKSILILIPIGLLSLVRFPRFFQYYVLPIIMIFFVVFIYFKPSFLFVFMEKTLLFLGVDKYANYFKSDKLFVSKDYGSNLGVLFKVMCCMYIVLLSKPILLINERYKCLIYSVFGYAVFATLASQIILFFRIQYAFTAALVYGLYVLWNVRSFNRLNKQVCGLLIFFIMILFIKDSFGLQSHVDPKRNPYRTIFMES